MSKRKKQTTAPVPAAVTVGNESVTTVAAIPPEVLEQAMRGDVHEEATAIVRDPRLPPESGSEAEGAALEPGPVDSAPASESMPPASDSIEFHLDPDEFDAEATVNLVGDVPMPGRDDLDAPTMVASGVAMEEVDRLVLQRKHLRGLLEALVFASDSPIKPGELAKLASAPQKQVKELLLELKEDYSTRGMHLDEVAGGWVFRTSPQYAPFVRDLTKQKPVRLTRAQVETLAIIAYRQPITRPEVDDVRGVDTGPVLKLLLERDLVRILGKRDEPGRPLIYGTTGHFLEFFGLKSLKDLPTLREFTELSDESRDTFEEELGESPEDAARRAAEAEARATAGGGGGEELGLSEDAQHDDHPPHESMRVPVGEHALDDLGADDLEPLSGIEEPVEEGDEAPDHAGDADEEAPGDPRTSDEDDERHASDEDGPTLTSEAPPKLDAES